MAIKIYEKFAPRANPADGDYPYGSIKNESVPGAKDGTPLDAVWANDYAGTDAELFAQAGIVPSGQPDRLGASQRVEATKFIIEKIANALSSREFDTRLDMVSHVGFLEGQTVRSKGFYSLNDGGQASYIVTSGTTLYPLSSPQLTASLYAKIQPVGVSQYSLMASGARNTLAVDSTTTDALSELYYMIGQLHPLTGGVIRAYAGQYYINDSVSGISTAKVTLEGDPSTLTYGTYESKTIFYFDDGITGDYALDLDGCQFMGIKDVAFRGAINPASTKSGIFLGKRGAFTPGFGNHLIERLNLHGCNDGLLLKNAGISTLRDIQASNNNGRGVALETSGDSNLYNIYGNDNNQLIADTSLQKGVGLYIGQGSNNTSIVGGKLEFNSKGLVIEGSNGVTYSLQFDYNRQANVIIKSLDDNINACRSICSSNSRVLSGGVTAGYAFSSIYLDSTLGSCSLSITGGSIQAAGNGAYDTSSSGDIGAAVGIYGNGNGTYSIDVDVSGGISTNMGTSFAAVAIGAGTTIKLSGTGKQRLYQEVSGGKVISGFSDSGTGLVSLVGSSGSAGYAANSYSYVVADGVCHIDVFISVNSVTALAGDLSLEGLPYISKSSTDVTSMFGVVTSVTGAAAVSLQLGSSSTILWKYDSGGGLSRLNGSDITVSSLLRVSFSYRV